MEDLIQSINQPITQVNLHSTVAIQIINHAAVEPEVSGQLLGLDMDGVLDVTYSFPFPEQDVSEEYQNDMLKSLREVNIDHNTIGFYQTSTLGNHISTDFIDDLLTYQQNIKNAAVIVYDPLLAENGLFSLKAYRLTEKFIELYEEKKRLTTKNIVENNLLISEILVELPVVVVNNSLESALLWQLSTEIEETEHVNYISGNIDNFIKKSLETMADNCNDLYKEKGILAAHHRSVNKQEMQQKTFIEKRKEENIINKKKKRKLLPETVELVSREKPHLFKEIEEPDQLPGQLRNLQIKYNCEQVSLLIGNDQIDIGV
eukprot:TRINITY_DN11690_c0_g1_i1.p1 TRINITY_DN11690_c0_g1~~TRINITY_DN11690_c0_g1_i1.p1  ORF type:complete len:317 (-),score=83.99 TRINITY_DN11690_c0_g1_i1:54-1004(-)